MIDKCWAWMVGLWLCVLPLCAQETFGVQDGLQVQAGVYMSQGRYAYALRDVQWFVRGYVTPDGRTFHSPYYWAAFILLDAMD